MNTSIPESLPEIDKDDQVTVRTMEKNFLTAQLNLRTAHDQLQNFVNVLFQKYGLDGKTYQFDIDKMEFVKR